MWQWIGYYCGASILVTGLMMWRWRQKYPNGGCMVMVSRLIDTSIVLAGPISWPYLVRLLWKSRVRERQRKQRLDRGGEFTLDLEKAE